MNTNIMPLVGAHSPNIFPQEGTSETINLMPFTDINNPDNDVLEASYGFEKHDKNNLPENIDKIQYILSIKKYMIIANNAIFIYDAQLKSVQFLYEMQESSSQVWIADSSFNQVAISNEYSMYILDTKNNSINIASSTTEGSKIDFVPYQVVYKDSRFIALDKTRNRFYYSQVNNGLMWGPLDYSLSNDVQGNFTGILAFKNNLYLFGARKIEIWHDTGAYPNPFQVVSTNSFEYGSLSPLSIKEAYQRIFFLGTSDGSQYTLMISDGGTIETVADGNIDYLIGNFKNPTNCEIFPLFFDDEIMVIISFLDDDYTLCYMVKEKKFFRLTDVDGSRYPLESIQFLGTDKYLATHKSRKGELFEINQNIYTYDGEKIKRSRIFSYYRNYTQRKTIRRMYLTCDTSLGATKLDMRITKNQMKSFGPSHIIEYGAIDKERQIISFRNLGNSNFWGVSIDVWASCGVNLMKLEEI